MSGLADAWAREDLAALSAQGLVRTLEPLASPQGPAVHVGGRALLNFSSNDYLGLAADPAVRAAAQAAVGAHGLGSGASRLVVGDTTAHQALEAALADFEGVEAVRLFNSGYAANTGVVPALVGEGDVVFSDAWNHASLVDGCRLSRAKVVVYPHGDVAALAALVHATPGRRRLLVTDAVFSMDGDQAPLRELAALARAESLALLVDEAHATGVLGATGRGLCEAAGVVPDVRVGTLSKALGAAGAWVAGSEALVAVLTSRARPLIFSTALPAAVCAGAEVALRRLATDDGLRERLWRNVRQLAAGLRQLGIPAHESSAIFSVVLGEPAVAMDTAAALRRRGLLVKAIRPPTVPAGTSRLRLAVTAAHEPQHVSLLLEALAEVRGRTAAGGPGLDFARPVATALHPERSRGAPP